MSPEEPTIPPQPNIPGLGQGSVELIKQQIEEGKDAFTVACSIKFFSLDEYKDKREDSDENYDAGTHIRSLFLKKIHGWGWTSLHDFLKVDRHAETIGYNPALFAEGKSAPCRTSISRAWNKYFGEKLKENIEKLYQWVRDYARATNNLIGDLMVEPEDRTGNSNRTEYRVKQELAHETAEKFRELFYDVLELNLPENSYFEKEDLFDFFLHIALTGSFANGGADTWREEVDDESTAPSGDTFRGYIRMFDELEEEEVTKVFNAVEELLWEIADQRGLTDNFVDVAIDEHDWLFYGDSDAPRITSVDPNRGTNKAYEFLTLSVVGDDGEKFVVGVTLVASRQEKRESIKDLLEEADDRLYVRDAYLDRGFYGTIYAQAMKETGVNFVGRAHLGSKAKKMWENAEDGVNVERVEMERSRAPYESVEVTRFVVPARDDADAEYMAFITNRELTTKQARRIGRDYKRRWGIETSFRVINDFLPKTASKDVGLRVWYYQMGTLLYNVWVLVNSVVAEALGLDKEASPPVTAKYMLTVMISKHGDHSIS